MQKNQLVIESILDYSRSTYRPAEYPALSLQTRDIMKFTEGGFRSWGYDLAVRKYGAIVREGRTFIPREDEEDLEVKDCICDAFLQNILLKPEEYDVVATLNLNGDYVSDALAAQVGGIGISPGANINYDTGCAIFEATHGIAPDIAGKDIVNPLSLVLSGEMLLRHAGFAEAADMVLHSVEKSISGGHVTRDFYNLMVKEGRSAVCVGTREFAKILISNL